MKSRLLICRSNPIAPDPRVEKEALALTQAGYHTTLLGWDRTARLPTVDKINGITCYRLPIQAEYATGIRNTPDLLRWQWGLLRWLVNHRSQYDIIHACDFDTVLPALISKFLFGKKVVYDIFDFYADHLRATPQWLKRAIRRVDLQAINWADALILVDDARWQQVQGARPKHSAVIYNSPDEPQLQSDLDAIRPQGGSLHLAYIGLLQVERGLFEVLNVLSRHPDWTLDLAGFGGDQETIVARIEKFSNVRWYGRVSYDQALQITCSADVLFATYDPSIPNHRYSSPNKIFEAMMFAKPIIVARDTNMDRIIEDANCGVVVPYGDEAALEKALIRLQADRDWRESLGQNGRHAYVTTYSWSIMKDRLLQLYRALLEPN